MNGVIDNVKYVKNVKNVKNSIEDKLNCGNKYKFPLSYYFLR